MSERVIGLFITTRIQQFEEKKQEKRTGKIRQFARCFIHLLIPTVFKGQLQRKYKLLSYERALKMLKNDICITVIRQADISLQSAYSEKKFENLKFP